MAWRLAYSLDTLLNQVNAAYPGRSKASDGTIGDAAHAAVPSDHNPNAANVVCALDITHDPAHGCDTYAMADRLLANRHPDLKYLISNRRIAGAWTNWRWAPYSGTSDPHTNHVHVSVGVGDAGQSRQPYDDRVNWDIQGGDLADLFNDGDRTTWLAEAYVQDVGQYADLVGKVSYKEALEKMRMDNLFRSNPGDVDNYFNIFNARPSDLDKGLWVNQPHKKFIYEKIAPGVAAMPPKGTKPYTGPPLLVRE